MIVLEVFLNKKLLTKAGSNDLAVLSTIVMGSGKLGNESYPNSGKSDYELSLDIGGMTARGSKNNEFLRWTQDCKLNVGDEITIHIIETDSADAVVDRTPAKDTRDTREKETFEWAKKTYFEFKDKYES